MIEFVFYRKDARTMKRKIYNELLKWKKENNGEVALLIDGARRIGKSYIVEKFAKENYKSYILIDFNKVGEDVKELFNNYLDNLDMFFMYLSSYYKTELYERETLIIFDEVQLFPRARSAIKYLVADGKYDYIETGSLISIKKNVENILIPSEERHLNMYPMDFEEFLWANDNTTLMPLIQKCFEEKKPMGQLMHRKAMDYFKQYLIVGGMPQAVEKYVKTKNFKEVDLIKRDILNLYQDDIIKYGGEDSAKVQSIFEEIPSQLQKHEKRFTFNALQKEARYRDYKDAFFWLQESMIVNNAFNTTEPNIGLRLNRESSALKCYMGDTGLLISLAFDEKGLVDEEIYQKILFNKLAFNEGMIMENIVAQMLVTSGKKLYFYFNYDKENAENNMEIDFLIAKNKITSRHNVSPIEVKSGKNYTFSSLNKFKKKYKEYLHTSYVLHIDDLKVEDDVIFLPVYMTGLL